MTVSLASTLEPVLVDLLNPEHPLRALVDTLPLLVSYVDRGERYRFNNLTYEVWFGRSRSEICGKHLREVLGETVYDLIRPNVKRALAGLKTSFTRFAPYSRGGSRLIRATYVPDRGDDGTVRGFFAVIEDLDELHCAQQALKEANDQLAIRVAERTRELEQVNAHLAREVAERWRTEQTLIEQERLLSELIETAPLLVVLADHEGRIRIFNQACERLTGYSRDEVLGQSILHVLIPDEWKETITKRFADIASDALRQPHVNPWLTKSGESRLIEWRCAALPRVNREPPWVLGLGVDITERRREEQITQQQQAELSHLLRLNALGEMATTLAHELNQPLAAILSYTQGSVRLLRASGRETDPVFEPLTKAAIQARRAGEIIQHIRRFVRRDTSARLLTDLNGLVMETASLLRTAAAPYDIAVQFELAADLPPVQVERVAIEQVVLNLFRNSVDALQAKAAGSRRITIQTRRGADQSAELSVCDNGPGISPDLAGELFQPFVSSKANGLGLGLPICRSIIRGHGGDLWVEPQTKVGADFRFRLPAANARYDPEMPPSSVAAQ